MATCRTPTCDNRAGWTTIKYPTNPPERRWGYAPRGLGRLCLNCVRLEVVRRNFQGDDERLRNWSPKPQE